MNVLALFVAVLISFSPVKSAPTVHVNAKNGDLIRGQHTFVVTVRADTIVTQVEFYVNGSLQDTATSTPYAFRFDSLQQNDGLCQLKFKAYTDTSQTGERTITVKVANGVALGAPYHVQQGNIDLENGSAANAVTEGEIALKANPKSLRARLLLARAYLNLGTLDESQRYCQDVLDDHPNNVEALDIVSAIRLKQAFSEVARKGTNDATVLADIATAMKDAVDSRRKALSAELAKFGTPTPANQIQYADALIRGGQFSMAVEVLKPSFQTDDTNAAVGERLAFAQLRWGRATDAYETLHHIIRDSKLDAYGQALLAVTQQYLGDPKASDASMQNAILADSADLGVETAQVYVAMARKDTTTMSNLLKQLSTYQGQRADVSFFLSALADRLQDYEAGRNFFQTGVLADPTYSDLYMEQANNAITISQSGKTSKDQQTHLYAVAKVMYETALEARPDSTEALAGIAVVDLLQNDLKDAYDYATAAVAAGPQYAGAHYMLAAAAEAYGQDGQAQKENELAGKLDVLNLQGREIPDGLAVWRYLNGDGLLPVMSAP